MKTLSKAFKKIVTIYKLIIATPGYKVIIFLQFVSGAFSIIGLPMLIPVLKYMEGGSRSVEKESYIHFMENALGVFGIPVNFYTVLGIAAFLILAGQCLIFISSLIAANAQAVKCEEYRRSIFSAYGSANWLWLINDRSGEMNYAVIKEAELASVAHLNAQRVFIYSIQVVAFLFVAIMLSPVITGFALLVYGLLAAASAINSNCVLRLAYKYNEKSKNLSNDLTGLQQNKKFFKTSLINKKLIKGVFLHLKDITTITKRENFRIEGQHAMSLIITFLFLIGLMFFHKELALSYPVLLLILLIFLRTAPEFAKLFAAYVNLDNNIPMYQSLDKRLQGLKDNEEENGSRQFMGEDSIKFENVSFTYPNGNRVFDNLNIEIAPHRTTAFIGSSGAGKSTLLDLVLGLLKPIKGTIYYGSIIHEGLDKNSLRSKIAYVSQTTTLVDGSMRDNLAIGAEDRKDEEIGKIAEKVGLKNIIDEMPKGINSHVGENGVKLSGGERQRVALARALFMEPKILILDEATSNLDAEAEKRMQETIKGLQKDFTIIIVTHKLSAVRLADRIYVLEEGRVCESGSYRELLERKGKLYFFDSLQK